MGKENEKAFLDKYFLVMTKYYKQEQKMICKEY